MGYESRIYIVRKTSVYNGELHKIFGDVIAEFNLGKVDNLAGLMQSKPETVCFIYSDDGDTRILEDRYGKPLTEASIPEAIQVIEEAIAHGDENVNIPPLLAALKAFDEKWWKNIVVLHYGY